MRFSPAETPTRCRGLLDAELGAHARFSAAPDANANVGVLQSELDSVRTRPVARPAAKRKLEPALTAEASARGR